jgi:hypothetical protein
MFMAILRHDILPSGSPVQYRVSGFPASELFLLLFKTFGTDAVAEQSLGMLGDVFLQLMPAILIIPDFFTVHADRDNSLQLLYPTLPCKC